MCWLKPIFLGRNWFVFILQPSSDYGWSFYSWVDETQSEGTHMKQQPGNPQKKSKKSDAWK